jgi:hypothetical protein
LDETKTDQLPKKGVILTDGDTAPIADAAPKQTAQPNILPDSRLKSPKSPYAHIGLNWVQIYCANCGKEGGFVPEENCNFAFYICDPCAEKLGPLTGCYMEPDAVFWKKVNDAMIEKYGRVLEVPEIIEALKDENHMLSKLARERGK